MADVVVAFLWHHHQPDYRDPRSGEALLPWTRLHGVKDYYAMARIAAEFPEVAQNFNLVPSMLDQLSELAAGKPDLYMRYSRKPASELTPDEKAFIIEEFFSANWNTLIEPFPRYRELLAMSGRKSGEAGKNSCSRFSEQDIIDLQVWFNLVWFHPYSREKEPLVSEMLKKQSDFTEDEKNRVLDLQVRMLDEVIPLYRALSESGQAELTTSPYYHPILPLLCDVSAAHESMHGAPLPLEFPKAPEDALAQMQRAVARHEELFGARPRGCWPSEGSVSTQVIDIMSQAGIEWCATDEEVLSATLSRSGAPVRLDGPERAGMLYRGYKAESTRASVKVIFRDHYLSDLIGFTYYTHDPKAAASDFVGHLHRIADIAAREGGGTWIVPVILDGENPWEAYPGGGLNFLRELFGLVGDSDRVRAVRISDYLEDAPLKPLDGLFAGSWIGHNFRIWIGETLNNKGWDYVGRARKALVGAQDKLPVESAERAWEALYKAEGSDWFWWLSEQHSSPQDGLFDLLFRSHLRSVYEEISAEVPAFIEESIVPGGGKVVYSEPYALLDVCIDGRRSDYFEWLCAGRYDPSHDYGAMARSAESFVREIYFGFDLEKFYIRIDLAGDASDFPDASIEVDFLEPRKVKLFAASLRDKGFRIDSVKDVVGEMAADKFVELAVPFSDLGIKRGQEARFQVEFRSPGGSEERLPFSGPITFIAPTEDFEQVQWQA